MSKPTARRSLDEATADRIAPTRDWFLRGSTWMDACWALAPTSALEEERPVFLRWDFKLPTGDQFTDHAYAKLLESSRRLIALVRSRSLNTGLPQARNNHSSLFHSPADVIALDDRGRLHMLCRVR
jgi:hypothetical protein